GKRRHNNAKSISNSNRVNKNVIKIIVLFHNVARNGYVNALLLMENTWILLGYAVQGNGINIARAQL
ncbi:hypothetical protein Tsp_03359, partial [Trichinella spiralis]|uniref:hypothetical protein n=1 Tax=Trichinella spiralis TaxID=6334 RepID=UPI0001EFCBA8